jgi:hemerythrin-like domain-containing protein
MSDHAAASVHDGPRMNALIHRAVRRDLTEFAGALDRHADGNRTRAAAIAARFHWLDELLTHHHEGEEQILWPVLRTSPTETAEVAELTDEHERIVSALTAARGAFARFGASGSAGDAKAAGAAVRELADAANEHFHHEEGEIDELCEHADPVALQSAYKKMGRSAGLKEGLFFMQWVSDGLPADDAAFLGTLIPKPVLWLSRTAYGRRYRAATVPLRS